MSFPIRPSFSAFMAVILGLWAHCIESAIPRTKDYIAGIRPTEAGTNYCAGVLVSSKYVLTSVHCSLATRTSEGYADTEQYAVLNSNYISGSRGGITFKIIGSVQHPDFNPLTFENDYLLLKLSETTALTTATLVPTDFKYGDPFKTGSSQVVMGWGINKDPKDVVISTPMTVLDDGAAAKELEVSYSTLAVLPVTETEGCQADFGSPVIATVGRIEYIGGIVSGIEGCHGEGVPYAASSVAHARTWIQQTIV